ncbi:hypothetical protein ACEUD4_03635 [Aeromonas media]|uniref:hypothetical protein n=1 Tax=Aeromonas TaxID=642 RepID=UPI001C44286E|nr:hypothetical protein [Aeromonas sp. sif0611]
MFALLVPMVVACGIVKDTARKRYRRWMPSAPWGEFHSGAVCLLLKSIEPCIDLLQRGLIRLLK